MEAVIPQLSMRIGDNVLAGNVENLSNGVDNAYLRVYNRIKSQEGELTVFRYCFNAVDNKFGNGMDNHTIGLTLSYSF